VSDLPGGVVAPLATPLTEMETLDVPALRQLVQHQVQAGADALFVLGSCGEGPLLLEDMSIQVIRTAVETAICRRERQLGGQGP
jgi:4-hydroxy-tetrahydrodipicolinate synthase